MIPPSITPNLSSSGSPRLIHTARSTKHLVTVESSLGHCLYQAPSVHCREHPGTTFDINMRSSLAARVVRRLTSRSRLSPPTLLLSPSRHPEARVPSSQTKDSPLATRKESCRAWLSDPNGCRATCPRFPALVAWVLLQWEPRTLFCGGQLPAWQPDAPTRRGTPAPRSLTPPRG